MSSVPGRGDLTERKSERPRRWLPKPRRLGRPIARSRRSRVLVFVPAVLLFAATVSSDHLRRLWCPAV